MVEIVWTEPALQDLTEIAEYIALDKVTAAEKLVSQVFQRVSLLEDSPDSGRKVPELRRSRYREVIVGPCRIIYRHSDQEVVIVHVVRSERLLRNYLIESP